LKIEIATASSLCELISATNLTWRNNITEWKQNDAWIGYNSTSKNLSGIFTGYMSNQKQKSRLDYKVDLRDYLPELVNFGLLAATGECFEKNNVKSWVKDTKISCLNLVPSKTRSGNLKTTGH
jgi:hypothetical protein